jgi:hypothetical protein
MTAYRDDQVCMHRTTDEEVDEELPQKLLWHYNQAHGPSRSATVSETTPITGRTPFCLPYRPGLHGPRER